MIYKGLIVKHTFLQFTYIVSICLCSVSNADIEFDVWKDGFKREVLAKGIKPSVFEQALGNVEYDPEIIKLDADQPEFTRNIWTYLDNAISNRRIQKGKALLKEYRNLFNQIESEYGVQREILVAIWAMESDYGRNYGNKNVIRSLATLAYHGKRSEFAHTELLYALNIIQNQKINPKRLIGSWAGAMGQPQFMPSSFIRYSVDQNKDGKRDLWKTVPDVLASIANFLAQSGWREGEHWGVEVKLPKPFDWRLNSSSYEMRFIQWRQLGVLRANAKPFEYPQRQASLFIPAGRFGPIFLVTHNFNVIKKYNNSSSYSLAVGLLSQLLAGKEGVHIAWPRENQALSRIQIEEIQRLLSRQGHNSGKIDGKIGAKTREAIRTWQLEQGLAGDGFASTDLLLLLRNGNE